MSTLHSNPHPDGPASKPVPGRATRWPRLLRPALALTVLAAAAVTISCNTLSRVAVAPPQIPGAEFVGSERCSECHQPITRDFHLSAHAGLATAGENPVEMGCESCHGPGSIHAESGGAFGTIVNDDKLHAIINPKRSADVCFRCHIELRGRFNLPHHHPVHEGHVSCTDCHDPHKGPAVPGTALTASLNDGCVKCHQAQRGPFVFEHEAMREGCTACHQPHGSVNDQLLTERSANLCLKCHLDVRTADIQIGGLPHQFLMQRGTCWSAGCHEAVHGSQVSSSLRY